MTTITAQPSRLTPNTTVRAGLALSAIIGLGNIPFLLPGIDWGAEEPPYAMLVLATVIGMVSVVCAVMAWNTGNRRMIRLNAAALIVNAVLVVPGLFVDTTAAIRVITAVIIVATVAAVVLMMGRSGEPSRVID